jgi:disulfide bond formation protein DsbB
VGSLGGVCDSSGSRSVWASTFTSVGPEYDLWMLGDERGGPDRSKRSELSTAGVSPDTAVAISLAIEIRQTAARSRRSQPVKTKWFIGTASVAVLLFAGACGGEDSSDGGSDNGSEESSGGGDAADGQELFNATCASCHGQDAENPSVGKDLRDNAFVQDNSDAELVAFVKKGRPASDPDNTTGTDMPAKGGNPSLSDEDLESIATYLKSLQ